MKKHEFLCKIEGYSHLLKGNGPEIASRAGIEYNDFKNCIRGITHNVDRYNTILEALKSFHDEHLQKVKAITAA